MHNGGYQLPYTIRGVEETGGRGGRDLFGADFEFFYAGEEFFGRLAVIVEDAEVAVPSDCGQSEQEADDPAGGGKGQFHSGERHQGRSGGARD